MPDWWDAYPDAEPVDKPDAPPVAVAHKPGGNWWDAYPDANPEHYKPKPGSARMHEIVRAGTDTVGMEPYESPEANAVWQKARQEGLTEQEAGEQVRVAGAIQGNTNKVRYGLAPFTMGISLLDAPGSESTSRAIATGVEQGGSAVLGLGVRGWEAAGVGEEGVTDELMRQKNVARSAHDKVSSGKLEKYMSGAVESLTQAFVGGPAGQAGVIATFMATSANEAYSEAKAKGFNQDKALKYAATEGLIEGAVTTAFSLIGLAGAEKIVPDILKGGAKTGVREFLKQTGAELTEENMTEVLHALNKAYSGVDPDAWKNYSLEQVADTTLQTLLTMGLGEAGKRGAQAALPIQPSRTELKNWAKANPEQAAQVGFTGKETSAPQRAEIAAKVAELQQIPPAEAAAELAASAPPTPNNAPEKDFTDTKDLIESFYAKNQDMRPLSEAQGDKHSLLQSMSRRIYAEMEKNASIEPSAEIQNELSKLFEHLSKTGKVDENALRNMLQSAGPSASRGLQQAVASALALPSTSPNASPKESQPLPLESAPVGPMEQPASLASAPPRDVQAAGAPVTLPEGQPAPPAQQERREDGNAELRQAIDDIPVEEMTHEQRGEEIGRLRRELQEAYTDPVTKLPGRQLYNKAEAQGKIGPIKTMIDAIGLGAVNKYGQPAGDAYLATLGEAAREAGLDMYRFGTKADEFLFHSKDDTEQAAQSEKFNQILSRMTFAFQDADGVEHIGGPVMTSAAIGKTADEAGAKLESGKKAEIAAGKRAAVKGELPPGLLIRPREERRKPQGRASGDTRPADGQVNQSAPQVANAQGEAGRPAQVAQPRGRGDTPESVTKGVDTASWVIRNKETGEVLFETFDKGKVEKLNTKKYVAIPILDHLVSFNKKPVGLKPIEESIQKPTFKQRLDTKRAQARPDPVKSSEDVETLGLGMGGPMSAAQASLTLGDTGLIKKAGRFIKTHLVGDMPDAAFERNIKRVGALNARQTGFKQATQNFEAAAKQAYGKRELTGEQELAIDKVLRGEADLRTIPESLHEPVMRFRKDLDTMSDEFIRHGIVQGEMESRFEANKGAYLHRSYKVFHEPGWATELARNAPEVINRFASFARASYAAAGTPISDAEVNGLIDAILNPNIGDNPLTMLKTGKIGGKDLGILTRRKDLPIELRALMGEETSPLKNYARSAVLMANHIENHLFLSDVKKEGMGKWLFEQKKTDDKGRFIVPLSAKDNPSLAPLDGLYTTAEIANAFEKQHQERNATLRLFLIANGLVKYGMTVGNFPAGHMRNFMGNPAFAVAAGHWRLNKIPEVVRMLRDPEQVKRMQKLGVIGEDLETQEIVNWARKTNFQGMRTEDVILPNKVMQHQFAKGKELLDKSYKIGDEFWKVYGFLNEQANERGVNPKASDAEIDQIAGRRVQDAYPTYSRVWKGAKTIGKFPVVGMFTNFAFESKRTLANQLATTYTDLKTPGREKLGAVRLAGLLTAASALPALARAFMWYHDVDDEEDKAQRRFVAPWEKNATLIPIGRTEDGKLKYFDASFTDPHQYLRKPLAALLRGEDPATAITEGTKEFLEPYLGEESLSGSIMDARSNKKAAGGKIFNEQDTWIERQKAKAGYIIEKNLPGSAKTAIRMSKALAGEESSEGKAYELDTEAMRALGLRSHTLDVDQSLQFKASRFQSDMGDASEFVRKPLGRKGTVEDTEIQKAEAKTEAARKKLFDELVIDVAAARKLGRTDDQIKEALEKGGLSKKLRRQVMDDVYVKYTPNDKQMKSRLKQALGE